FGKLYTTSPTGEVEIGPRNSDGSPHLTPVLSLNLPSGPAPYNVTYMLTATIQFANTANLFLQNNNRTVICRMGLDSWAFRLAALGNPMDGLPITLQTIWTKRYDEPNPINIICGVTDGGTDRSWVFARTRRFTATHVQSVQTQ